MVLAFACPRFIGPSRAESPLSFVDLTAEHNFAGNGRLISFAQTSAPVIVNHWAVSRGKDTYGRISGGASANLGSELSFDLVMSTTIGRNDGQETSGQLGLKARF